MFETIQVNYDSTNNINKADTWLRFLDTKPLVSCDFEVALKEIISCFNV